MFSHDNARRVQLNTMTRDQLLQVARSIFLWHAPGVNKADLINLILRHEAAQAAAPVALR
jgi:hypothetical protein